jgi:hypothetical protein
MARHLDADAHLQLVMVLESSLRLVEVVCTRRLYCGMCFRDAHLYVKVYIVHLTPIEDAEDQTSS